MIVQYNLTLTGIKLSLTVLFDLLFFCIRPSTKLRKKSKFEGSLCDSFNLRFLKQR